MNKPLALTVAINKTSLDPMTSEERYFYKLVSNTNNKEKERQQIKHVLDGRVTANKGTKTLFIVD